MAGVNLNEENACILATNSELIGTVIHSCADEPFLFLEALRKKILNIGENKAYVTDAYGCSVSLPVPAANHQSLKRELELRSKFMYFYQTILSFFTSSSRKQLFLNFFTWK